MGQPHKHAELIKLWAEGAEIEIKYLPNGDWHTPDVISWLDGAEYRIKPEPPKYPQTKMADTEVLDLWRKGLVASAPFGDHVANGLRTFANAAIARAIEDRDVVPAAMLENVAKDAAAYGYNQAGGHIGLYLGSDFYDIIAKVKEGK